MTAFIIVCICLLGIRSLFDFLVVAVSGESLVDQALKGFAIIYMVAVLPTIVCLSLLLAR
jgi:hypothetical protein